MLKDYVLNIYDMIIINNKKIRNKELLLIKYLIKSGYKDYINFNLIFYKYIYDNISLSTYKSNIRLTNLKFLIKYLDYDTLDYKYIDDDDIYDYIFNYQNKKLIEILINNNIINYKVWFNGMSCISYKFYKFLIGINYWNKYLIIRNMDIYYYTEDKLIRYLLFKEDIKYMPFFVKDTESKYELINKFYNQQKIYRKSKNILIYIFI